MVIIDATHERYNAALRRLVTPAQLAVVLGSGPCPCDR
jgi:hypothetical protein